MTKPARPQLRRTVLIGAGGYVVILVALVTMLRVGGTILPAGPARILAGTVGVSLLVLWWWVFAIRITGMMDEYQRWMEHRAWYVGGLAGLMASVPIFAFIGLGGLHWLNPATDVGPVASRAFTNGYLLPMMMQVVGATAFALWHRLAKR